jgi:hypothetical protein
MMLIRSVLSLFLLQWPYSVVRLNYLYMKLVRSSMGYFFTTLCQYKMEFRGGTGLRVSATEILTPVPRRTLCIHKQGSGNRFNLIDLSSFTKHTNCVRLISI